MNRRSLNGWAAFAGLVVFALLASCAISFAPPVAP